MSVEATEFFLKECTHFACPGVHAFLFQMRIGDRDILGKDKKTFDEITKMFGKEFLYHTIVVFTSKENLCDETLDQYVSHLPDTCQGFINSCKGGYLAVSNCGTHEMEQSAKQVVDKIEKKAREIAKSEIKFEGRVNFLIGGAAVLGGIAAAVATGGIAGFAVAGPVIQTVGAAFGTIAGTTITGAVGTAAGITAGTTVGTAVGGTVGLTTGATVDVVASSVVEKFRGFRA
ncbi:GTPase IMAP family member 9-like [Argopecten irradians]|uniref:GTPase IMAP family member 9-like n=1 Tax=Argopecten irradians TaxID=31199 RepID=UPI003721EBB2